MDVYRERERKRESATGLSRIKSPNMIFFSFPTTLQPSCHVLPTHELGTW